MNLNVEKTFSGNTNCLLTFLTSGGDLSILARVVEEHLSETLVVYTDDIRENFWQTVSERSTNKRSRIESNRVEVFLELLSSVNSFKNSSSRVRMMIFDSSEILEASSDHRVSLEDYKSYCTDLDNRFCQALISPGDPVGVVAAQSCSERFTQSALNTFHMAGAKKSAVVGIRRIGEILNATKSLGLPMLGPFDSSTGKSLVSKTLADVSSEHGIVLRNDLVNYHRRRKRNPIHLFFKFPDASWFDTVKNSVYISPLLRKELVFEESSSTLFIQQPCNASLSEIKSSYRREMSRHIVGLKGCEDFDEDDGMLLFKKKWCIMKSGNVLKEILKVCPDYKIEKLRTNDMHFIAKTLGISAAEKFLEEEICNTLSAEGINIGRRHISLIAANMTSSGEILPNNFEGVNLEGGVILKATIQESTNTFAAAAARGARDNINDLSAQILMGCKPRLGTNLVCSISDCRIEGLLESIVERETQHDVNMSPLLAEENENEERKSNEFDMLYVPASPMTGVVEPEFLI